ncbi:MAG: hypothetical protein FJY75_10640, partial [Candidatus Eisenbacteria bacterium]|nr:hypothetical protein [Candidatus Eisenbacteria bacterium]
RIDSPGMAVWYVLSAWTESKQWCGVEFGFGGYDGGAFLVAGHGACFPSAGLTIPTSGWPGPGEGIALAATDTPWAGNFQAVYWIAGYVYSEEVIPLSADPANGFGGWAGCEDQEEFAAAGYGGMGLLADGIYACPQGEEDDGGGEGEEGEDMAADDAAGELDFGSEAACCIGACCEITTELECQDLGGQFHPEWGTCAPNPCSPAHPPGSVIRVEPDGSGDYCTIQDAVDGANEGDVILLGDGIFTGVGNAGVDLGPKNLTIRSASLSPSRCVIDGTGSLANHAFWIHGGQTSATRIQYITIQNFRAQGI